MVKGAAILAGIVALGAATLGSSPAATDPVPPAFTVGRDCLACHNGLTTPAGEDVSIGAAWQASMMAHSGRDPYWVAAVRRETIDHPERAAEIQRECAACHMPMLARAGGPVDVFAQRAPAVDSEQSALARDGVSCTVCHQIEPDGLGTAETSNGAFRLAPPGSDPRKVYGPHAIAPGLARVMHSASRYEPAQGAHVQSAALCATCHTLTTHAFGAGGAVVGTLPEQAPYAEWRHSAYAGTAGTAARPCQACHMPEVAEPTPIASVLGEPRPGLSRHTFVGANAFMLRLLDRHRDELRVEAPGPALEAAAVRAERLLATSTATLAIAGARREGGRLVADVVIENLAGHKLPTGYPSRRVWIELVVRDGAGRPVFASGTLGEDGRIAGNDADASATAFEPHHDEIARPEDVQIYESTMVDAAGAVTTGLLSGVRYVKDNRLLPRGFDPSTAPPDVAVHGDAARDASFVAGGDRVRYRVDVGSARGPFRVEAILRYQPIAWRWAHNLGAYDAPEPRRFVAMYAGAASRSASVVARAAATVE